MAIPSPAKRKSAEMKNGIVVEKGTTQDIFSSPKHEYTKMLLEKVPSRIKGVSDNNILENSDNSHKQDVILEVNNLDVYYKERNAGRIFSLKKKLQCRIMKENSVMTVDVTIIRLE